MWQRLEGSEYDDEGALVTVRVEDGKEMVRSFDEFVDLLDLPLDDGSIGTAVDCQYTNHCTTFRTEDMWPI